MNIKEVLIKNGAKKLAKTALIGIDYIAVGGDETIYLIDKETGKIEKSGPGDVRFIDILEDYEEVEI